MNNEKKQQIIELLKDKEVADSIGVISEGLVKLFESIPADKPEEKKPYDPGFWVPKSGSRFYEAGFVDNGAYARSYVCSDPKHINRENCWESSRRAIQVGKQMKFLMLVERIADIVCPNLACYPPEICHNAVAYSNGSKCFCSAYHAGMAGLLEMRFPSEACARKVCDILNSMKSDGQLDWLFDE